MPERTNRQLIENALTLLASRTTNSPTDQDEPGPASSVLPTAAPARTVNELADAGTVEVLDAQQRNPKQMAQALFDWSDKTATKATAKTIARLLTARDTDGVSRYSQAVEVISYAVICAPLLNPDRLLRVLEAATDTPSAYGPIRYPAQAARDLATVIGHYPDARREQLCVDLWHAAHDGRWWDHTAGLGLPRRRRGGRGEAEGAIDRAAAPADRGDLADELLNGVAFLEHDYSDVTFSADQLDDLRAEITAASADPDVLVAVSRARTLRPLDRPESPIPAMLDAARFVVGDDDPVEALPAKPKVFADLFPEGASETFTIPEEIARFDRTSIGGQGEDAVYMEIIRTPAALHDNARFMGNCTAGYLQRCIAGTVVMVRLVHQGEMYNADFYPADGYRVHQVEGNVRTRGGRGRAGTIPPAVRSAIADVAAAALRGDAALAA